MIRPACATVPDAVAFGIEHFRAEGQRVPSPARTARMMAARPVLSVSNLTSVTAPEVGATSCSVALSSTFTGSPLGSISIWLLANGVRFDTIARPHGIHPQAAGVGDARAGRILGLDDREGLAGAGEKATPPA